MMTEIIYTIKNIFITLNLMFVTTVSVGQITISSVKLGDLRINMPIDSVNKFLETKIKLKNYQKKNEVKYDTVRTTYKDLAVRLIFVNYFDFLDRKQVIEVKKIFTDDNKISTKSGIKIGDNKFDIVRKLDGNNLSLEPDREKGKQYSTLILLDTTAETMLTFHFKDNMLFAIELEPMYEYDC